jgi:hypothetical protein
VGAWLHKNPCFDYATREFTDKTRERALDVSVLLLVKELNIGFICNCSSIGHTMRDGDEGKEKAVLVVKEGPTGRRIDTNQQTLGY